jgi:hypothetical protein
MDERNPYAPPTSSDREIPIASLLPAPSAPTRAPYVLGILSIVFASFILLFGSCTGLGGFLASFEEAKKAEYPAASASDRSKARNEAHTSRVLAGFILSLSALSAPLLAIGIGSVRFRRWTLRGTRLWAAGALLHLVGLDVLSFLTLNTEAAIGWTTVSFFLLSPYPILLLIFFFSRRVSAVLA